MDLVFGKIVFDISASHPVTVMTTQGETIKVKWLRSKDGDIETWAFGTSSVKDLEEFDPVRWEHRKLAQEALTASEPVTEELNEEQLELF